MDWLGDVTFPDRSIRRKQPLFTESDVAELLRPLG